MLDTHLRPRATFLRRLGRMIASLSLVLAGATHANAQTMDTLGANEALMPNEFITSLNGGYQLIMQGDGNLVLYRTADMQPLWNTRTAGNPGAFAVMQGDGNLVVYLDGRPLFNTRTQGNPGARLVMQTDGNLVIYSPSNRPLFASRTVQKLPPPTMPATDTLGPNEVLMPNESITSKTGEFLFIMQGDGNLVLYRLDDARPLWNSRTAGNPGAFAIMQGDGNLVVYLGNRPLFNTRTQDNPGARLVMQSDGNLVILTPDDRVLFASGTRQPVCMIEERPAFGGRVEDGIRAFNFPNTCRAFVPLQLQPIFVSPILNPFSLNIDACVGVASFAGFVEVEVCR